nr:hypothetical protein [Candidatus Sigynarchaeum springense]
MVQRDQSAVDDLLFGKGYLNIVGAPGPAGHGGRARGWRDGMRIAVARRWESPRARSGTWHRSAGECWCPRGNQGWQRPPPGNPSRAISGPRGRP